MRLSSIPVSCRAWAALLGIVVTVAVACVTPRLPLRGIGIAGASDLAAIAANDAAYRRVQAASVELGGEYSLTFLEFDNDGRPGSGQLQFAVDAIREDRGKDALVVLFVHGWGHSADARDDNVVAFRQTLHDLSCKFPARSVVGIYVSWRARWLKGPGHYLTYMDRSFLAQELGGENCCVRKAMHLLQQAVEQRRQGRAEAVVAVAVGHSLGGQFLFSYMEEWLDTDEDEVCEGDRTELPPSDATKLPIFGDLVLLINPAQDTNDYRWFPGYHACNQCTARPVVVSFSSEDDRVVGVAYRIGRTLRTLFLRKYWGQAFRGETIGLGWDEEQLTHVLCSKAHDSEDSVCDNESRAGYTKCADYRATTLFGRAGCAPTSPFAMVRVDREVVRGHGDMFNPLFAGFLEEFVLEWSRLPAGPIPCPNPAPLGAALCPAPNSARMRRQRCEEELMQPFEAATPSLSTSRRSPPSDR